MANTPKRWTLILSPRAYTEISMKLAQVGQLEGRDASSGAKGSIALDGIAVQKAPALSTRPDERTHIEVTTILSQRTGHGMVDLSLNAESAQMDLDKAREVVGMLQSAIEAAISDELLMRFLTERVGMPPDKAAAALADFRELRQGSRDVVYPH